MSTKGANYHIGLDSQGYQLVGAPDRPARRMNRAPVFGNRFASGDRDYTDFSLWWYWAQTDWSGGFKDDRDWADDAKFYYSTNIDAHSQVGAIKLMLSQSSVNDFAEDLLCGAHITAGGNTRHYVGTADGGASKPIIYKLSGSWSDISGSDLGTTHNFISQIFEHKGNAYFAMGGTASADNIAKYDDSTWSDLTATATAAFTGSSILACRALEEVAGTLYMAVDDFLNDHTSILATSDEGSNISEVVYHKSSGLIIDMEEFNGDLYYLINFSSKMELWVYDISATAKSKVATFYNTNANNTGFSGGRLLHNKFGKLVITVPANEVWTYDGSDLTRVYVRDTKKISIGIEANASTLNRGAVSGSGYLFWSNLIYDGVSVFNGKKNNADSSSNDLVPLYVASNGTVRWTDEDDDSILYEDSTSTYRSGSDENFIVFSEIAEVSTIDKLSNSVRIIFEPFDTGEEIEIQYSLNGGSTYTTLGSASRTVDGATATQKTFYIGDDVDFKKMIFKVLLNGDGTSTPTLYDISLQYLPTPDYKYQWTFSLNCSNEIRTAGNKSDVPANGIDLRNKIRTSFLQKEIVSLEDVDYAETALNGSLTASATTITVDSTDQFAESGRIRINDEEIFYNGKTATTFKNCVRGYRGTTASAHSDNDEVSNEYKVFILDYQEQTPVGNDSNIEEFIVSVDLIEA